MIDLPMHFSCYLYDSAPNFMREGVKKLRAADLETAVSMLELDPTWFRDDDRVALLLWRDRNGAHRDAILFGDGHFQHENIKVQWNAGGRL